MSNMHDAWSCDWWAQMWLVKARRKSADAPGRWPWFVTLRGALTKDKEQATRYAYPEHAEKAAAAYTASNRDVEFKASPVNPQSSWADPLKPPKEVE